MMWEAGFQVYHKRDSRLFTAIGSKLPLMSGLGAQNIKRPSETRISGKYCYRGKLRIASATSLIATPFSCCVKQVLFWTEKGN